MTGVVAKSGTLGPLAGIEPVPCDSGAALYNQQSYKGELLRVAYIYRFGWVMIKVNLNDFVVSEVEI